MRIKVEISNGLVGCSKYIIVDVDAEAWQDMSGYDRDRYLFDYVQDEIDWNWVNLDE